METTAAAPENQHHYRRITAGPPSLSDEQVRRILRDGFGTEAATLRQLPGETDRNIRVVDDAGTELVLKVVHPSELTALRLQNAVLADVAAHDPGLPVPVVVPGLTGEPIVPVGDGDGPLFARLLTWLPGAPLSEVGEPSEELLTDIGATAGRLAAAMAGTRQDGTPNPHYWNLARADVVMTQCLPFVSDQSLVESVETVRGLWDGLAERFGKLPTSLVHHDLNTLNVLVDREGAERRVSGVIDFGDVSHTARVADLAVLLASVMRTAGRPLPVAATVAAAYQAQCPLTEEELDVVYPLALVRLATVAATTARMDAEGSHGDTRHRSAAAARLLRELLALPVALGTAAVRRACGLNGYAAGDTVRRWLDEHGASVVPVVDGEPRVVDLSAASTIFDDADPRSGLELRHAAREAILAERPAVAVGRHGEPRFLAPVLRGTSPGETRHAHLGVDVFAPPGSSVRAPLGGTVEGTWTSGSDLLARHEPADGVAFWTRYRGVVPECAAGAVVRAGQRLGRVAGMDWDDELPPRVHVQAAALPPSDWVQVPPEVPQAQLPLWEGLFPDPTPLLGDQQDTRPWAPAVEPALEGRRRHLPATHPTYFRQPITMVRARDCWFYDEHGQAYLDALNNVTLLGHGHPRLVRAAERQLRRLNTNSRFVYELLTDYTDRLTATLPDGLDVVYLLNSGSEANDLALRMARYVTGREDFVVVDDAYHGNTSLVSDVSPSRYRRYGKPETTHPTPVPDRYRGEYGYDDPEAGPHYARHTVDTFDRLAGEGRPAAAYIYESLLAGGGQVVLPPGYLSPITAAARAGGVLTIADEVQVGFGRLGEAFWGFQTQGPDVVPDFVAMGKSMGNGFPVAALVTTREISRAFDPTGRFFSTYGGNPVSCAVGLELLNVLEEEGLQDNALVVGQYFRDELVRLADRHELIGDVRGQGFYSGVELVSDRSTREPAVTETLNVCERLKDEGVLVYTTGPFGNVLKLKPPLSFTPAHVDLFVEKLDRVLGRGW